MQLLKSFLTGILCLCAPAAFAATYTYDVTYDGVSAIAGIGSDTIDGSTFDAGDSFDLTLSTAGDDYWSVDGTFDAVFVPLSFLVEDSGTRTADIVTTFYLDGVEVAQIVDTGVSQEFNHIGAQTWTLVSGLEFDEVVMNYDLVASTATTVISSDSDIFEGFGGSNSPFYTSPNIGYNQAAVVPLPAGLPLALTALGLLGIVSRRRKSA